MSARTIFVTSVKGGVGKTNIVLNLAGTFELMKKKTLIIDLDFYSSSIAFSLNQKGKLDLYDIVNDLNNNNFNNIEKYINKYDEFIDTLNAPKDPRFSNKINSKYIDIILSKVKNNYDVILIDSNHFLDDINLSVMEHVDQILYVINNDPINLKNMKTFVSIYHDLGQTNYKIVLNNSNNKGKNYYTKYDINYILGKAIDYTIPEYLFEKNTDKYIINGEIQTLKTKSKKELKVYERLANSLIK